MERIEEASVGERDRGVDHPVDHVDERPARPVPRRAEDAADRVPPAARVAKFAQDGTELAVWDGFTGITGVAGRNILFGPGYFNTDFGLINNLFGLDVDWFGGAGSARVAVILVQLWLGYPYMFLVATGALQAIPPELSEASRIDGASPWQSLRRVTLPLLLVALTPLLISSFAFNFNNFNAIYLTTDGGPFAGVQQLHE